MNSEMMELPAIPQPSIKDIDTVGDARVSIDDLNDTIVSNNEGLNTEATFPNNNQYNAQYIQAMPASPNDNNNYDYNNSYNYNDKNNNMDQSHQLNQMQNQLNTLVKLQSQNIQNKNMNSVRSDDNMLKKYYDSSDNEKIKKSIKRIWICIAFLIILLVISLGINFHYILYRIPCACMSKENANAFEASLIINDITNTPTNIPSINPTVMPTKVPSKKPSKIPSQVPSDIPTINPTLTPSFTPTKVPSVTPSETPTMAPSNSPTSTSTPSSNPTTSPSFAINTQNIIPQGVIAMWNNCGNIPTGWSICNGNNGTPDLSGKFIVGGDGSTFINGASGGSTSHNHDVSYSGTSNSHTLTINEMPSHTHRNGIYQYLLAATGTQTTNGVDNSNSEPNVVLKGSIPFVGGNQGHSHGFSFSTTSTSINHLPPYYVMCYIMKTDSQIWYTKP